MVRADAIAILGCRVLPQGQPSAALARRIDLGWRAWQAGIAPAILACGGRCWHGVSEAQVIGQQLRVRGVPAAAIQLELCSLTTLENGRYAAEALRVPTAGRPPRNATPRVWLATCSWHVARASRSFERFGVRVLRPDAHWYREPADSGFRDRLRERIRSLADTAMARAGGVSG